MSLFYFPPSAIHKRIQKKAWNPCYPRHFNWIFLLEIQVSKSLGTSLTFPWCSFFYCFRASNTGWEICIWETDLRFPQCQMVSCSSATRITLTQMIGSSNYFSRPPAILKIQKIETFIIFRLRWILVLLKKEIQFAENLS